MVCVNDVKTDETIFLEKLKNLIFCLDILSKLAFN